MKLRSRATVVIGLLVAGTVAAATAFTVAGSAGIADPGPVATALPAAARTSFPGLTAATGEPELASVRAAHPRTGQILQANGPFDDRFVLHLGADGHTHAGAPQLREEFTVQVPAAMAHRAVSVAIGVPVLVNE